MFLVWSCSCLCSIYWIHVLSWGWKCSWSSADRRCSNYIWVINSLISHKGASYIRDFTVISVCKRDPGCDTLNTILNCLQRYEICIYNTGYQIMKWWALWNITMILRHRSCENISTICHVPNDLNVNGKHETLPRLIVCIKGNVFDRWWSVNLWQTCVTQVS